VLALQQPFAPARRRIAGAREMKVVVQRVAAHDPPAGEPQRVQEQRLAGSGIRWALAGAGGFQRPCEAHVDAQVQGFRIGHGAGGAGPLDVLVPELGDQPPFFPEHAPGKLLERVGRYRIENLYQVPEGIGEPFVGFEILICQSPDVRGADQLCGTALVAAVPVQQNVLKLSDQPRYGNLGFAGIGRRGTVAQTMMQCRQAHQQGAHQQKARRALVVDRQPRPGEKQGAALENGINNLVQRNKGRFRPVSKCFK